jgi:hypothetical protein
MISASNTSLLAATICLLLPLQAAEHEDFAASIAKITRATSQAAPSKQTPPNLTPQNPSVAPLLRRINLGNAAMIPAFYCERVPSDRETEVDVPPFDWGVANDRAAAITQPFTVVVLDGQSKNTPLVKETVPSMPESGTRVFRNWPGRPTRVHVIKITTTHPQFSSEYGSTPGCYIPTAQLGRVKFDPQPLIVRVDAGGQITERVETDNDLRR